jgi:hypothetical protein
MNMFAKAKAKGATKAAKPQKEEVIIKDPNFHMNLHRLATINSEIDTLSAEAAVLGAEVKERGISEFTRLYQSTEKYPGSFNIQATGFKGLDTASFMFIPTDRYIKIDEDRYNELTETHGEGIATETTTYIMDSKLVEKHGETISELIAKCKSIPQEDKDALIQAVVSYTVAKGTISDLTKYDATIPEMLEDIKPVYQLKNVKIDEKI